MRASYIWFTASATAFIYGITAHIAWRFTPVGDPLREFWSVAALMGGIVTVVTAILAILFSGGKHG